MKNLNRDLYGTSIFLLRFSIKNNTACNAIELMNLRLLLIRFRTTVSDKYDKCD